MKAKDMKILAVNSNSIKVLDAIKKRISENIQLEIDDKLNYTEEDLKKYIEKIEYEDKKFVKKKKI